MVDEEQIWQEHELTGVEIASCDLCGRPVPWPRLIHLTGNVGAAEPVEEIRVCEECSIRIAEDDVPFDEEIGAGLQAAEE